MQIAPLLLSLALSGAAAAWTLERFERFSEENTLRLAAWSLRDGLAAYRALNCGMADGDERPMEEVLTETDVFPNGDPALDLFDWSYLAGPNGSASMVVIVDEDEEGGGDGRAIHGAIRAVFGGQIEEPGRLVIPIPRGRVGILPNMAVNVAGENDNEAQALCF